MKVFIIGPEGSGKTVFLAMLSRYVGTERKDLVLEPADKRSADYVMKALMVLEEQKWPDSTKQGDDPTLNWRFGRKGSSQHDIVIYDAAGQNLRQILLAETPDTLTPRLRNVETQIATADVLIYLLDLENFIGTHDLNTRYQNVWLFRTFLTRQAWSCKRRIVVLSKADIYVDMLEAPTVEEPENIKVRNLIKKHLPKDFSTEHLVDAEPSIRYMAITSVMTKLITKGREDPQRMPQHPLRSDGLNSFVDLLCTYSGSISRENRLKDRFAKLKTTLSFRLPRLELPKFDPKLTKWVVGVLFIIALAVFLFSGLHLCPQCQGVGIVPCKDCEGRRTIHISESVQVTCIDCSGSGKTGFWGFRNPCPSCKGLGKRSEFHSKDIPCETCKAKGTAKCWRCLGTTRIWGYK